MDVKNSYWCCFTICFILWIFIHVDNDNSRALVDDPNEADDVGHEFMAIVEDKFELKVSKNNKENS